MKKPLILLIALFISFLSFGQKKNKDEAPDTTKIDSLTAINTKLSAVNDSISKELEIYYGVYVALKDDVFKADFDPAKTSVLLDSIFNVEDKAVVPNDSVRQSFRTSLDLIQQELLEAHAKLDSLLNPPVPKETPESAAELEKTVAIGDLKNLKALLDAGVISQTEFVTLKKKYLAKL